MFVNGKNMNIFNIIAGIASILSLIISVIAIKKVYKFETKFKIYNTSINTIDSQNRISQKAKGNNINQSGRDIHV